ncbi:MAG: cytochrome b/b6 domain-containing protein, partial [Pseudomonadota bacterium]|nr:cytochrome b/b6 domain-containing protein [Pseudomonadota bacterium]
MKSIDTTLRRVAVWDLPIRLFHWSLAALIGFSWWSAEQQRLEWHMWSGFAILTLLLFRLMWGFVGSSTARFRNFVRGPRGVLGYVANMRGWSGVGHTPLGALSVVALLGLVAIQVATGLINSDDDGLAEGPLAPLVSFDVSDAAHELHDQAFDILLVFIGFHVAAILVYRLTLGKRLIGPMVTGLARIESETEPMRPARKWLALACLVASLAITRWIIAGAPP